MKRHEMRALFNEAQEAQADCFQLALIEILKQFPKGPISVLEYTALSRKIESLRCRSFEAFVVSLREGLAAYKEKK